MKLFGFHYSSNTISFILIVVIIFGIYSNIFNNSFVWDDEYLVTNNIFIRNPRYIKNIFTEPLFYKSCPANYYRPVQTLSYLFDYHFWKLSPFGYHLTNILIHTLNIMLIFLLINALFKDKELSLLTSLFFAICPLHVSVVTYISGRADLLVTFFILSALLLFIKSVSIKNNLYYLGSVFCFLLALLSKEPALVFPFILLLTHKVYKKSKNDTLKLKDATLRYIPFFLFSLTYIILRITILNFDEGAPLEYKGNSYLQVLSFCQVILSYIKLIFVPISLYMQRRIPMAKTIFNPFTFLSIISVVFILIVIIKSFRRSSILFWSLSWFLITLIPVYFVIYFYQTYDRGFAMMAEHWLYIPLIGFFTLFSFIVLTLYKLKAANLKETILKKIIVITIGIIVFFYVLQTIKINTDWQNNETLFSKILRYAPDDIKIQGNLLAFRAKSYLDKGDLDEAIKRYKEILNLNKDAGYIAHSGLGTTYFKKGNFKEAINEYKNAIVKLQDTKKIGSKTTKRLQAEALRKTGIVYFYQGLYTEAEGELNKAIDKNPLDAQAYCALGVVYAQQGRFGEALTNIKKSLEIDPFNAETYNNLGLVYANMGDMDKAIVMWQKAIRIDPNFIESRKNLQKAKDWTLTQKPSL